MGDDMAGSPATAAPGSKQGARPQSLQDTFLGHVRDNNVPLTVFLVNGVKLQGVVTWFDNFSLLLKRSGEGQLVYKHAISTIMPMEPISLYDGDEKAGEPKEPAPAPRRPVVEIRRRT
jgi:host factor-I protein